MTKHASVLLFMCSDYKNKTTTPFLVD